MQDTEKNISDLQAPKLIKKCRKLGWTQKMLAARFGMEQQSISRYLAGRVMRERYDFIEGMKEIVSKGLQPPMSDKNRRGPIQIHSVKRLKTQGNRPKKSGLPDDIMLSSRKLAVSFQ